METRRQGTTLFTAICVLIGVLVVIQLWLVAASLDALRSDNNAVLLPAFIASLAVLVINAGLLRYIVRFDGRIRKFGDPRDG